LGQLPRRATSDERYRGKLSPEGGGRWRQTSLGRPEKMGPSCARRAKRTSLSWASFRRWELRGGGLQRRLDDGERKNHRSSVAEGNGSAKGIFPLGRPHSYRCARWCSEGGSAVVTVGMAKWWRPLSEGRRCSWAPLFGQGQRPVDPARFHYFPNYPKLVETCTIEMDALSYSKNS
jgi:hypothetical protein